MLLSHKMPKENKSECKQFEKANIPNGTICGKTISLNNDKSMVKKKKTRSRQYLSNLKYSFLNFMITNEKMKIINSELMKLFNKTLIKSNDKSRGFLFLIISFICL